MVVIYTDHRHTWGTPRHYRVPQARANGNMSGMRHFGRGLRQIEMKPSKCVEMKPASFRHVGYKPASFRHVGYDVEMKPASFRHVGHYVEMEPASCRHVGYDVEMKPASCRHVGYDVHQVKCDVCQM